MFLTRYFKSWWTERRREKEWYEIRVPFSVRRTFTDYVNYSVTPIKSNKVGTKQHVKNAACYGQHMWALTKYDFACFPNSGFSYLPEQHYLKWMQWCYENHLIPSQSHFYRVGYKNCATFSVKGEMRHRIYTGLCCYRWSDSLSPLPYTVVELLERNQKIHFFQALHYGMKKYLPNTNHSFSNIHSGKGIYGKKGIDLAHSIAMKSFFDRRTNICETYGETNYTNISLDTYSKSLKISLPLEKESDILRDCWNELYFFDPKDAKGIMSYYKKHI